MRQCGALTFWMWYGPSLCVPRGICRTTIPSALVAVLHALAESDTRTVSGFKTGPAAAPAVAALGTEGSTAMKLFREPRAIAVSTATCSREVPRLLAGVPRFCAGRGMPRFCPCGSV